MAVCEAATYLLQYGIAPTAVVGGVAWLFKTIVVEGLQRERAALTAQIERDSALAIERVRSVSQKEIEQARHSYSQALEEKKVRFARLQDKRLDPILQMHSVLVSLVEEVEHVKTILKYEIDNDVSCEIDKIIVALESANLEFAKTRIFLPESLARSIGKLIADIENAEQAYYVATTHEGKNVQKASSLMITQLEGGYRKLLADISDCIRALLGVENAAQTL